MTPIGTVEILRTRVYPLDAESHDSLRSEVVVEAGTYDLFHDGMAHFWLMHGVLDRHGAWRMGDGMFALYHGDDRSDIPVTFPSRRFGPDEWATLVSGPECVEGPQQRLRVTLNETAPV